MGAGACGVPPAVPGPTSQPLEEGGAATLWIACHLFLRDPITMAALALGALWTSRQKRPVAQVAGESAWTRQARTQGLRSR